MRVISISLDQKILNKNSKVFQRMKDYASMTNGMHIICHSSKNSTNNFSEGNLFIYPTKSITKFNFITDAYKIGKEVIKNKHLSQKDSIITTQDPFETGLVGYFLKRKLNLGLNIQDHGNFFESKHWRKESFLNFFRYFLGKFIVRKSNSIRTVSDRERKYIEKKMKYRSEKIIDIPVFTDWEKIANAKQAFNLKQKYPGFDFYVLTVCRLEKVKNIPLLLAAFSDILKQFPKTLLLIVGSGSQERNVSKIIEKNRLKNNVMMKKWTDDLAGYYKSSDLFVLTSFSEGWGLTVIESAASKCPVVMTDTGCAKEFINDKNGWIVPINDKNKLVKAIFEAMGNSEKRKLFSDRAFDDLANLPTKEITLNKLKKSWELALL